MKKIYLLFCALVPIGLLGQAKISGIVLDKEQEPLPYATIAFQSLSVSELFEGTFSSADGRFELTLPHGTYRVTIQMVGFQNRELNELAIDSDFDLGEVILQPDILQLEEVVVRAERSYIESDLGKKTLYIGADLANAGGTAINALEALPSVTTTVEGNVNVRGSENVIIYINGRETKRDPKSLQFISADALQKIELITNPSAKYDAEGVAGIINLIYTKTKSTKLDAFMSLSKPFRAIFGINGGISSDKFSLFVNASERLSRFEDTDNQTRLTPEDDLRRYENLTTSVGEGATREITAGVTYEPDTSFSLALEVNYLRWDDSADGVQQNTFSFEDGRRENLLLHNDWLEVEDELSFTLSSEKKFGKSESLKFQFTSGGEDETNRTNFNLENVDLSGTLIEQSVKLSDETEDQRHYQAKLDYTRPIHEKVALETGFVSDFFNVNVNQDLSFFQSEPISNRFQIRMKKYAGYALLEDKRHRLEYALGIRYENFESESIEKATDSTFVQRFQNVFPSIQWRYTLGRSDHSLGFNFTRRINRPSFWEVSPFISYTDPLNLETGNPFLKPEFGYLYELNYSNSLGKLAFDLTAFRRTTENVIQRFTETLDADQLLVSYRNFGARNDDGFEWSTSFDVTDQIVLEASGSGYKTTFQDQKETIFFQNRWNWQTRFKQQFRFGNGWGIDLVEYYRTARYSIQSTSLGQYYFNVSMQKSFLEKRGTATLSFRDVFNTRVFGTEIVGENFNLLNEYKFQTQVLTLSLRYKVVR